MAHCEECNYTPDPIWPREKRRARHEPWRHVDLFWLCRSCRDGMHPVAVEPARREWPRWAFLPVLGTTVTINLIWALVIALHGG